MSSDHGSPRALEPHDGDGDVIDGRDEVLLRVASVLFTSGDQTSRTTALVEALAERWGRAVTVRFEWGHVDLISEREPVRSIPAVPDGVNMARVQRVIDLAGSAPPSGEDLQGFSRSVDAAARLRPAPTAIFALAAALGAVALSIVWGVAEPVPLLVIALAAGAGAVLRRGIEAAGGGQVLQIFAAALLGGAAGAIAVHAGLPASQGIIAIGSTLVLVPGPHLLNGGLDLSGGRITLGMARLTFALIVIFSISAGVVLGFALGGEAIPAFASPPSIPLWVDALCAATAAGCYAIFFSMPLRLLLIPVVVGAAAHSLHALLIHVGLGVAAASGVGALLAGVVLVPVAVRMRIPFAGIGFAAVVAMMPTVYLHRAVSGLLQLVHRSGSSDPELVQAVVVDLGTAVLVIVALVVGLVVPLRLERTARRLDSRRW